MATIELLIMVKIKFSVGNPSSLLPKIPAIKNYGLNTNTKKKKIHKKYLSCGKFFNSLKLILVLSNLSICSPFQVFDYKYYLASVVSDLCKTKPPNTYQ